jgi:hypothetical protein
MTATDWKTALKAAGDETAQFMTSQIREDLLAEGLDSRMVAKVRYRFFNNKFEIKMPPKVNKAVKELNFGSSTKPPTGVLQKFENRTQEAEKFLSQRAVAYMAGGKK